MHVHAQAMVTIREQERREWLATDSRHRHVAAVTSAGVPMLRSRRAHAGQMVRAVAATYRSLRSARRQKLA